MGVFATSLMDLSRKLSDPHGVFDRLLVFKLVITFTDVISVI